MRINPPSSSSPQIPPPNRMRVGAATRPSSNVDGDPTFQNLTDAAQAAMAAYDYTYKQIMKADGSRPKTDMDHATSAVMAAINALNAYLTASEPPGDAASTNARKVWTAINTAIHSDGSTLVQLCAPYGSGSVTKCMEYFEGWNGGHSSIFNIKNGVSVGGNVVMETFWYLTSKIQNTGDLGLRTVVKELLDDFHAYKTCTIPEDQQALAKKIAQAFVDLINREQKMKTDELDGFISIVTTEIYAAYTRTGENLGVLIDAYNNASADKKDSTLLALVAGLNGLDGGVVNDVFSALNEAAWREGWNPWLPS